MQSRSEIQGTVQHGNRNGPILIIYLILVFKVKLNLITLRLFPPLAYLHKISILLKASSFNLKFKISLVSFMKVKLFLV